jgi:hypothetical protein
MNTKSKQNKKETLICEQSEPAIKIHRIKEIQNLDENNLNKTL